LKEVSNALGRRTVRGMISLTMVGLAELARLTVPLTWRVL